MPTITIGTDAFSRLASLQSRAMGHPDLAVVLVEHPLGGIDPDEVREKARLATDLIVERLGAKL